MTSRDRESAGYAECERITRCHGTTYYWGARLLPAADRRHVYALYSLARLADDIVDYQGGLAPEQVAQRLADFEARFWDGLAARREGRPQEPIDAAISRTVLECGLPDSYVERFFTAMRTDLVRDHYDTWADLLTYMDGSAAVIGEMMLPVLRPRDDIEGAAQAAREAARALGLAFQLTNFLRDVAEDLDRGRVYLPQRELAAFGVDLTKRRVTREWREFMRFQIERNRRLYREADLGLELLPGRSRRCVATARVLYARILDLIEDADYDVFSQRVRVSTPRKVLTAGRMIAGPAPERAAARDRAGDPGYDRVAWRDDSEVVLLDDAGRAIGTGAKSRIHHDDTPLHLAFSCYVVDDDGALLVTRRAAGKRSFPGVVTNSVCGHPRPGEALDDAVHRRARDELGIGLRDLRLVLPEFRYRAVMSGIVEHELCPVFVARIDTSDSSGSSDRGGEPAGQRVRVDPAEVGDVSWIPWERFAADAAAGTIAALSPWCREQVQALTRLGDDPHDWPEADPALLPPAATLRARHSTTRP